MNDREDTAALGAPGISGVAGLSIKASREATEMLARQAAKDADEVTIRVTMHSDGTQSVSYLPDRVLPRNNVGDPIPDVDLPHSQLGMKEGRNGDYLQVREWGYDANGKLVPKRDIDFTDHGRPQNHPNPHQHEFIPNSTGGTLKRDKEAKPLK